MFKFGFEVEEPEAEEVFASNEKDLREDENDTPKIDWYPSEEVHPTEDHLTNLNLCALNSTSITSKDVEIHYVHSGSLIKIIDTGKPKEGDEDFKIELSDIKSAESKHSDLLPGVYEGGAKIWECTIDMIEYFSESTKRSDFEGKRVLDLGCGSGLLGIFAQTCGATVHFQDYNKDVLETLTIPNVLLNYEHPTLETIKDNKFYSGDWSKYVEFTREDPKFDYIFTSETIYNPINQQKLLDTFAEKLAKTGTVYLGAKIHYFGVGGGIRQFEELLKKDHRFKSDVVWTSSEGVQREILTINWND